jgi:hypothetical protein
MPYTLMDTQQSRVGDGGAALIGRDIGLRGVSSGGVLDVHGMVRDVLM